MTTKTTPGATDAPADAAGPRTIRRADYRPPDYLTPTTHLHFALDPQRTIVTATSRFVRQPHAGADAVLALDGESLELLALAIDGRPLGPDAYRIDGDRLLIGDLPDRFELRVVTAIAPAANRQLSGLYASSTMLLTQCEAQGFRRITWWQDRPDVMSRYTVELDARHDQYPVLLANGNLVASRRDGDRHATTWEDPFPKPSYLFALVAGRLEVHEDRLRTRSGRDVQLQVWVEPGNLDKTQHAMDSLKRAIRWDETRYGLELDLDRFMIVAVSDFNMGAMENKGLNIFNAKYLFANPRIATDDDFARVESIVGHEYFHNWTGNRVTCRDWFQLTLKEGLTVFRDQEFSADMIAAELVDDPAAAASARAVHRIEAVRVLRAVQFAEDAGPMKHPIRPDSYQAIDNFYTATVYEKGAEVIRMLQTLVGQDGFRRGIDRYFERHDGQAVTCDDFVAAIADANGRDLRAFMHWYATAGTPLVQVRAEHDAATGRFSLVMRQLDRHGTGQPPLQIPIAIGLLDARGREVLARTLELDATEKRFDFDGFAQRPVASLLRGFSAPIQLQVDVGVDELAFLLRHDTDPFNRWEAGQQLMLRAIQQAIDAGPGPDLGAVLVDALGGALDDRSLDAGFRNQLLILPSEGAVSESLAIVEPQRLRAARNALRARLGAALRERLAPLARDPGWRQPYRQSVAAMGARALANTSLVLLCAGGDADAAALATERFDAANNMTDRQGALSALMLTDPARREAALAAFAAEYANDPTVLDKWFLIQATMHRLADDPPVLERVQALTRHPAFGRGNPNKVRSLIHAFCSGNLAEFHRADGRGYAFWAEEVVALDATNPQLAARLARALDRLAKFDEPLRRLMREAIATVRGRVRSPDVTEILDRAGTGA